MGNGRSSAETKRIRRSVFRRDCFTCVDCRAWFPAPRGWNGENIEGLTLGHIKPKARGGTLAIRNLVAQCRKDNEDLGDLPWVPNWREVYNIPRKDTA